MNWLILTGLLAYLGFLYWYISRRYLPRSLVMLNPAAEGDDRHRLARSSFKLLHVVHSIVFFLVILWLPVSVALLLHVGGKYDGLPELSIWTNMTIDLGQIDGLQVSGLKGQVLRAKTEIDLDAPNYVNAFIFAVTRLIKLLMVLFVILQLRNILASLCNGDSFSAGNSRRLDQAGKVIVFAYLVGPAWNWFLAASVINTVTFSDDAITLAPATQGSWIGLFVGVGLLILSAVIREAEHMLDEQRYTI